jgi:hypothetical protein
VQEETNPTAATRLMALVDRMKALTEDKIEATLARNPLRLEAVLAEEAPSLLELRRLIGAAPELAPAARDDLRREVSRWQQRTQYLQRMLETQLGYVDFARYVLGVHEVARRVDESV